jgi:hypothetical protein
VHQNLSRALTASALFSLVAFGAGCSANTSVSTAVPAGPAASVHATIAESVPDTCNKTANDPIKAAGGSIKLPACATFTGGFTYGSNNAPAGTTLSLLATPKRPSGIPVEPGTPLLFLQGTLNSSASSITFNKSKVKSNVHSSKLLSSKTYTLYAFLNGSEIFSVNLGSPTNNTLKFASPFDGQTVPANLTVTLEIAQN